MLSKSILLASAAALTLAAGGARAQDAAAGVTGLETIVVTAQKRAEDLQKTPIAITAISQAALAASNTIDANGLQTIVPNIRVQDQIGHIVMNIRGLGASNYNPPFDAATVMSRDGVLLARATSATGIFFDVSRVEILRGPQGTLEGRDALAGSVHVITNKPTDTFGGAAAVQGGSFDEMQLEGMVNIPITDTLAMRAAFKTVRNTGIYSGGFNDADDGAGRVHVLWKPTDRLTVLVSGNYLQQKGHGPTDLPFPQTSSDPWHVTYPAESGQIDNKQWSLNAEVNYDLGFATLTYIPAVVDDNVKNAVAYQGGNAQSDFETSREYTQELRLGSNHNTNDKGELKWVAGLYYYTESESWNRIYLNFPSKLQLFPKDSIKNASYAVFGQGTYSLTDKLRFTAGLRYTRDTKSINGNAGSQATPTAPRVLFISKGSQEWNILTWKAEIDADVLENSMVYFSAANGFHEGGIYDGFAPNTFNPEKVTAFEIGSKNRFLDNRLQINVAAYYYLQSEVQQTIQQTLGNNGEPNLTAVINSGDAKKWGLETTTNWLVTDDDRIDLSLTWAGGHNGAYVKPPGTTGGAGPVAAAALSTIPKFVAMPAYDHTFHVGGSTVTTHVGTTISSGYNLLTNGLAGNRQKSYHMSDASLTYAAPESRWTLGAFVRNIENEPVRIYILQSSKTIQLLLPPRTYGVRLAAKF